MLHESPAFFLGANSPSGFVSLFDHLYSPDDGWFSYILKGGPGTGKSTLMKRAARDFDELGTAVELIHCSSDPDSLDAVIFPQLKTCIVDGTAPHTLDPVYPGVADTIVNLGECWDPELLKKNHNEILDVTRRCSSQHQRSRRYLAACGALAEDTARIARSTVNFEKAETFAAHLAKKKLGAAHGGRGREKTRLLSAISPDGVVRFDHTASLLCQDLILIEDEYDAVDAFLLDCLRELALSRGLDVVACYCPMAPLTKLDALLVPQIGVGFLVSNSWHPCATLHGCRTVHARRFIHGESLAAHKQKLSFNRRTQRILQNEAVNCLAEAKRIHDTLETLYASAMDYSKTDKYYNRIYEDICSRMPN